MIILAKMLGILIAAFGLSIFAFPKFTGKVFDFFKQGKRIYGAGVIRVLAGLVLFLAAPGSVVPAAAIALGVLFLVSGIVVFILDLEKLKNFLAHYSELPGPVIRLLGLIAASFGLLVVSLF